MTAGSDDRTPVTLVSGTLGAGKTTLVNRVLRNEAGYEVAVLVNDMGEVNVDAQLVAGDADGDVVDLTNGCICCRLNDDLADEVVRLADDREFDCLLVEASGISEPYPVAKTFLEDDRVSDRYRLDTLVSVLDAYGFWKEFDPETNRPDASDAGGRELAQVLVDQVEFCDVLLLNKCDLVPDDALDEVEDVVRELQPRAELHRTTHADVSPETVLDTGLFDFDAVRRSAGWKRHLAERHDHADGDHDDHTGGDHADHDHADGESHGVSSFCYETTRPFHPERFDAWIDEWPSGVYRAKGFFLLATRPETVMGLNRAGPSVTAGPIGEWRAEDDPATRLVFIGTELDEAAIREQLDGCLLTDEEATEETDAAAFSDPFPTA
ncbi:GTP-binding protein [Halogeometricum sp. CBA1124]|uniref:CobW family GTP-binding protein n=1 Tax=Halogeometricum sp. CBA1124 TaxID=2668071 RepID=UPI0014295CF4|nr:GTP-binding protein [Halogeometricum sp. CBA1124]MUV58921.1 GTP-binding protein [Halogeometricum sp. CBA1124]